jgi:hypothetical protein
VDLAQGHDRRESVRAFEERASALAAGVEELGRSIRESQAAVGATYWVNPGLPGVESLGGSLQDSKYADTKMLQQGSMRRSQAAVGAVCWGGSAGQPEACTHHIRCTAGRLARSGGG